MSAWWSRREFRKVTLFVGACGYWLLVATGYILLVIAAPLWLPVLAFCYVCYAISVYEQERRDKEGGARG